MKDGLTVDEFMSQYKLDGSTVVWLIRANLLMVCNTHADCRVRLFWMVEPEDGLKAVKAFRRLNGNVVGI